LVIDEVDTHQRLAGRPLRSHKPVGVIQELYGLLIAHYAIRYLMHEAALQEHIDPDRLSFVHALQVVAEAVPEFQMIAQINSPAICSPPARYRQGASTATPARSNPRVVKRKMSNFRLKRPEHYHWPQPTGPFGKPWLSRAIHPLPRRSCFACLR